MGKKGTEMNALELAEIQAFKTEELTMWERNHTAAMLRQQQDEIEALKANRKHDFGLGEASGFIKGHKENPYKAITNTKIEPTVVSYTHPAKELTDEEISQVYKEVSEPFGEKRLYEIHSFARAILRKAQEK